MRRRSIAALILVIAAVVAASFLASRNADPVPAIANDAEPVRDGTSPSQASAPESSAPPSPVGPASTRARSEPLPAEGTSLAAIADELAARARAGDNAAAMRLAFDLQYCQRRGYAEVALDRMLDRIAEQPEGASIPNLDVWSEPARAAAEFCAGLTPQQIDARGEWVLLAATRGDTQAMVCYVAHPNDLGPAFLSDAWFKWSQRWRERAPRLADEAYARGQLDVLTLLAESYSGNMFEGVPLGMAPLQGLVTPDHARAAAYAEIAHRAGLVNKVYADIMRAQLDGAGRQRAEAIVDRDAQRFVTQKHALKNGRPCRGLWKSP